MDRSPSLLFRLPQELRDEAYLHYVWRDGGYCYDAKSGKMRTADNESINLALVRTCKQVASEMHGLALEKNELRFVTSMDTPAFLNSNPRAFLFAGLLEEQERALQHMLSWARSSVTPEILRKIKGTYPECTILDNSAERSIQDRYDYLKDGDLCPPYSNKFLTRHTLLQDLVQLIAANPHFGTLTSKKYMPSLRDTTLPDYLSPWDEGKEAEAAEEVVASLENYIAECAPLAYDKETQYKLLSWRPAVWDTPSLKALSL